MNYFFQNTENGEIKIGYSGQPAHRKHELELEIKRKEILNPKVSVEKARSLRWLRVLAVVGGDKEQERMLHELFKDHRMHGEWFGGKILKPAIHWIFDWCEKNTGVHDTHRKVAYDLLWSWIVAGVGLCRLQGEITWCGRRWDSGVTHDDISGARFFVPKSALDGFAERLVIKTE